MAIINIVLGANVNGALNNVTGHLVISGTGAMDDWTSYKYPLYPHKGIVKTVEIQDGVTTIGERCFEECTVLTNITIPNSVTSIGAYCFCDCYALTSIVIPNGVTSLLFYCFSECRSLESIILPNTLTLIKGRCFYNCIALKSITFPNTLKTIGHYCFRGCSSLKSIVIPNSVTALEYSVFPWCSSLSSITFEEPCQITAFPTDDHASYGMFYECSSLSSLTIPSSITAIGRTFAKNCNALTEIINNAKSVQVLGTNPFFLSPTNGPISVYGYSSNTTFKNAVSDTTKFTWNELSPSEVATIKLGANISSTLSTDGKLVITGTGAMDNWSSDNYPLKPYINVIRTVEIQDGITSIGSYCFNKCTALTEIVIPSSITTLEMYCFYNCTVLANITIPEGITILNSGCFCSCAGLSKIVLPEAVTSIGSSCFRGCTILEEIVIPHNVTTIGSSCFENCKALKTMIVPKNVVNLGDSIFKHCINLTTVFFEKPCQIKNFLSCPHSHTGIFFGCTSLPSVYIPNTVEYIGSSLIKNCSVLTEIINMATLPQQLNTYAFNFTPTSGPISVCGYSSNTTFKNAVSDTTKFTWNEIVASVMLGDNVEGILLANGTLKICGYGSMYNTWNAETYPLKQYVASIKAVEVQDSITSIGNYCFYNCEALTSVILPKSIIHLGNFCFYYCRLLASAVIPDNTATIGNSSFYYCTSLSNVTIPSSVSTLGINCFYNCSSMSNLILNEGIATLGQTCFSYCASIGHLILPESITEIGDFCFEQCVGLISATNKSKRPQTLTNAFENINSTITPITIHGYSTNSTFKSKIKSKPNFKWNELDPVNLATINLGTNVSGELLTNAHLTISGIGEMDEWLPTNYALLDYLAMIEAVEIQDGVTTIGANCFLNCQILTSFTCTNTITKIGESCFDSCIALATIVLSKSITSLPTKCFHSCRALQAIIIPENITSLGDYCFKGCLELKTIIIPKNVTEIGSCILQACGNLTKITSPSKIPQTVLPSSLSGIDSSTQPITVYGYNENITLKELCVPPTTFKWVTLPNIEQSKLSAIKIIDVSKVELAKSLQAIDPNSKDDVIIYTGLVPLIDEKQDKIV